jgi:hypothetical protein
MEKKPEGDNPVFIDILKLAIVCIRFAIVTRKIRNRGVFVATRLHELQDEVEEILVRLRKKVGPAGVLLSNLGPRGRELEEVFINLLKKDI